MNPFVHATFHATIENQASLEEPPQVARALDKLQRRGLSRHEAVHQIGNVFADEF